jgi:uncharacterized protein
MTEIPQMPWQELRDRSSERGLLAKRLYVVNSTPTNGLGPILANLDSHLQYQARLERDGIMFAAGPLASEDLREWLGDGLFVYRAESMDQALGYAADDPMHISGARSFTVREWMLNEGTLSVQLFYSGAKHNIS